MTEIDEIIPKIAFTFWEGHQLTYMHALTIITFQKYNPDFRIIIYVSNNLNAELIKWNTGEHTLQYSNLYDINQLKNINNVELIEVDVNKIVGYNGTLSVVWKSDILRLLKLYEHGGMYIDFDILFINKIPDKLFKIDKLMFNTYYGLINNAVIISKKENYILKIIIDHILKMLKTGDVKNEYMQFGPTLITHLIKNTALENDVYYIPNDMTCPYLSDEMNKLFFTNIDQTTENTFALHWYNGDKESRNYCSNFNINNTDKDRCIFEKLLISTNTTIPCSIISTNTIVQPIKISIVMAFYNRRPQLLFTLKTIRDSQYKNIEIIIVNDASDKEHEIDDILGIYDLNIKIINIKIEEKTWVNPCIAYNIGFKQAVGDIILIQNPEVCHIGDCLTFTINNLKSNDWLSFNCYGLDDFTENKYINDMYTDNLDNCDAIFNYINNKPFKIGGNTINNNFPGGWINHYDKFFVAYHYMAAIYKNDLFSKMNGGFHDEYRNGTCKDDNDFIKYLIYNNFNFKIPKYSFNNPFCIHQYHDKTTSLYNLELFKINDEIYKKRMKQINAIESCDIVTGFMPNPIIIL